MVNVMYQRILNFAKSIGANGIARPQELALPGSKISDAAIHFVKQMGLLGKKVDYILLLQPTNPLRSKSYFAQSVSLLHSSGADCVFTALTAREKWGELKNDRFVPANYSFEEQFHHKKGYLCEHGMMYLFRVDSLLKTGSYFGDRALPLQVDPLFRGNDIDEGHDIAVAELLYKKYKCQYNFPG
jgi:CMP-N-acetylneuraminic acid synthetase